MLCVQVNKSETPSQSSDVVKRFIVPLGEYRKTVVSRIRNLRPENAIYVNERKHSCLGQALNISIRLSESTPLPTRLVYMVGNPCTTGPGLTISPNFK